MPRSSAWVWALAAACLGGCNGGPLQHDDGEDTATSCDGVRYGEVCFTVEPLRLWAGYEVGHAVFHQFENDSRPTIVGAMDDTLYVARFTGAAFEISTAPIEVFASSWISIGDFAGDGKVRIVLRGDDSDSVHVVDGTGLVGSPTIIPLEDTWSPAAAMGLNDGSSILVGGGGAYGTAQTFRLQGDTWIAQAPPFAAPDYLAWSFDANGDGLRDVGLSSLPGPQHPDDTIPGVQIHVLVSDGAGEFSQHAHVFEIPCGVTRFFPVELTGDGILDLACYTQTDQWGGEEPYDFGIHVAAGQGDGNFGFPEQVFFSNGPNAPYLRGFANLDGVAFPEAVYLQGGDTFSTSVLSAPWTAAPVDFAFDVRVLDASDMNGDGIDDLVVHNKEGAYALLSD